MTRNFLGKVRGRDKTTPTKYSLHLSIMFEWFSVLGRTGYAVYSLYVAITALGIEIGTRQLAAHLGISQQSFLIYTELLDLLGLVKLHRGSANRPNIVDILDPPAISLGDMGAIKQEVLNDEVLGRESVAFFRNALFKRLDKYSTLIDVIGELPDIGVITVNGQRPITTSKPDDSLVERLQAIKFDNPSTWLASVDHELVRAWLHELETDTELRKAVKHPAGFLRAKVASGEKPVNPSPPDGMHKCRCGVVIPSYMTYCNDCKNELGIET